jgi:hypothetical protein
MSFRRPRLIQRSSGPTCSSKKSRETPSASAASPGDKASRGTAVALADASATSSPSSVTGWPRVRAAFQKNDGGMRRRENANRRFANRFAKPS